MYVFKQLIRFVHFKVLLGVDTSKEQLIVTTAEAEVYMLLRFHLHPPLSLQFVLLGKTGNT